MFTFSARCVVRKAAGADPLGVRTATTMGVLLIVLVITVALSVRAGLYGRRWTVADRDAEGGEESWLVDACARTFVLVLLSLLGLLALGMAYGNVLGAVNTGH